MTFFRIFEYLRYRWRAKDAHGIHSPFIYEFYNLVLHHSKRSRDIEVEIRKRYLENRQEIQFSDPKTNHLTKTTIQNLAKKSWSGKSFSYFLLRLCEWLKAESFLETGTSLGITLSVVSQAHSLQKLYSIEGSRQIFDLASKLNFVPKNKELNIVYGPVQDTFENVLIQAQPDVVFLDADHRSETITFYMNCLRKHGSNVQAIVIHDIYWSTDMQKAWNRIVNELEYPLTIDCFDMGIIFPHVEMEKQHFVLKY